MATMLKEQAVHSRIKRGRPITLVRWHIRGEGHEPEIVQGTFLDTTEVYWRVEINGQLHAYPASIWALCLA